MSEFRSIFTNAQSLLTSKTKNCFSLKPPFEAQTAVSQIIKVPHKKTIDWIFILVGKTFCHVIHVLKEGLGPSKYPATNIY